MDLKPKLQASCQQKLILTQGMQQSLAILQLSQVELGELIAEEIEKNPLLEVEQEGFQRKSKGQTPDFVFPDIEAKPSLDEWITGQIRDSFEQPRELEIALELSGLLDEKGFLPMDLSPEQVQILPQLQRLDPPGIFAQSCREGFMIQLERSGKSESLAHKLVSHCYEDLLHKRFGKIEKLLHCSSEELTKAIQILAKLSTRPAASFCMPPVQTVYPDLQVTKEDEKWEIQANEEALPKFRMKEDYSGLSGLSKDQKELMKGFAMSGKWLMQSIARRRELLLSIGTHLVKTQTAFLNQEGPLVPMCPAELATLFGVHESTISRALADKYLECPLGSIPLRSLISTHGNDPAKQLLQKLILQENKKQPLTDDQLAEELNKSGHKVARRTVAKYRMLCKIGSASTRKHIN